MSVQPKSSLSRPVLVFCATFAMPGHPNAPPPSRLLQFLDICRTGTTTDGGLPGIGNTPRWTSHACLEAGTSDLPLRQLTRRTGGCRRAQRASPRPSTTSGTSRAPHLVHRRPVGDASLVTAELCGTGGSRLVSLGQLHCQLERQMGLTE